MPSQRLSGIPDKPRNRARGAADTLVEATNTGFERGPDPTPREARPGEGRHLVRLAINAAIVLSFFIGAAEAAAQCTKDVECKGNRVCHRGECVEPIPYPAATSPALAPPLPVAQPVAPPPAPRLPAPSPATPPPEDEPSLPGSVMISKAPSRSSAPRANRGFQLAFRTGYAQAFGNITNVPGDTMGSVYSGQMPLILDVGGKLSRHWFLGAYTGIGLGSAGGGLGEDCRAAAATCVGVSFRLGALAEYNFLPSRRVNPWLGFGMGLEYNGLFLSGRDWSGSISAIGVEIVSLLAGFDVRLSPGFGVGPFVAFSFGTYVSTSVDDNGAVTRQTITNPGWHEWFMLGVRMTFRP